LNRSDSLAGWVPLYLKRGSVVWGYMGRERFVEPFCQETLQKLAVRPFNQLLRRQSGLDLLLERAQSHPGLPLRGIVFHMSRCGSTLAAQSLAALPDSVVLSEPESFDTLLQWLAATPARDGDTGRALLRGLLSALGQPRRDGDRRLFVKTDCWHVCHIDRILPAFPGVPWIFLYRDPVEVLVSQARTPALYLVPGSLIRHGVYPPEHLLAKPLEHGAWVLSRVLRGAAEAVGRHPGGLLVNYGELPEALETRVAEHFALNLGRAEIEALRAVSARDSKRPYQSFQTDSAAKHAGATDELRDMAARWLHEPYAALEEMRIGELPAPPGLAMAPEI
jgi:hypothetical protein